MTTHEAAPQIQAWLDRISELSEPPSEDLALRRAAARRLSNTLAREFTLPVPQGVEISEHRVTDDLLLRRYRRADATGPQPTQVHLHGGGFVFGSVHEEVGDRLLGRRAWESGVQMVAVEYRLAPEHPFPAALEDALLAVTALRRTPDLGADPDRIGIGGVSAGGGIAAGAALLARDRGIPLVHQALEVPAAALRVLGEPSDDGLTETISADEAQAVRTAYLPAQQDSPGVPLAYAEPALAPDLTGVAPASILLAEHDALRPAGELLADRLREAGVPVSVWTGAGHLHATAGLTATFPAAREWNQVYLAQLRDAYETRQRPDEETA